MFTDPLPDIHESTKICHSLEAYADQTHSKNKPPIDLVRVLICGLFGI